MTKRILFYSFFFVILAAQAPSSRAAITQANISEIELIQAFFEASVLDGSIVGALRTDSDALTPEENIDQIRGKLNNVHNMLLKNQEGKACFKALNAEQRSDGDPQPLDRIVGGGTVDNAKELSKKLFGFRGRLGCYSQTVEVVEGEDVTITSDEGFELTIPEDTIEDGETEITASITTANAAEVEADTGDVDVIETIQFSFESGESASAGALPKTPFKLSIPAPSDLPVDAKIVIGRQIKAFTLEGIVPVRKALYHAVAVGTIVATPQGDRVETSSGGLPGIFESGIFAFFSMPRPEPTGAGNSHTTGPFPGTATGHVASSGGGDAAGATVSSNAVPWIALTDPSGNYSIPVEAAVDHSFNVLAFAPLTGESRAVTDAFPDSPGTDPTRAGVNITLVVPTTAFSTFDGIRNGGFERGDLSSWVFDDGAGGPPSAAFVTQSFGPTVAGPTCTTDDGTVYCSPVVNEPGGDIISPTEGEWMAVIATGPGSETASTRLRQSFIVPAGVQALRFDFNFVSEEFPEWVGTAFNDTFLAIITTPNGNQTIAQVQVNDFVGNTAGIVPIGDCGFSGGDRSCGMTDWQGAAVDLSTWAGTSTPITVELVFTAQDFGDEIFDTFVFLDNIRFSTLWLDVVAVSDAALTAPQQEAQATRIREEVKRANEILSQTGINVEVRDHSGLPFRSVADPTLTTVDVAYTETGGCDRLDPVTGALVSGRPLDEFAPSTAFLQSRLANMTPAQNSVVSLLPRATPNADLRVYYVPSGGASTHGNAIGPDDYCDNTADTDPATAVTANRAEILETASGVFQTRTGLLVFDSAAAVPGSGPAAGNLGGEVLAHEISHILLSPYGANRALEHGSGTFGTQATNNLMQSAPSTAKLDVTRIQSIRINASPLLVDNDLP